jgi:hypothetical protein
MDKGFKRAQDRQTAGIVSQWKDRGLRWHRYACLHRGSRSSKFLCIAIVTFDSFILRTVANRKNTDHAPYQKQGTGNDQNNGRILATFEHNLSIKHSRVRINNAPEIFPA